MNNLSEIYTLSEATAIPDSFIWGSTYPPSAPPGDYESAFNMRDVRDQCKFWECLKKNCSGLLFKETSEKKANRQIYNHVRFSVEMSKIIQEIEVIAYFHNNLFE